jgi:hypothetical protein
MKNHDIPGIINGKKHEQSTNTYSRFPSGGYPFMDLFRLVSDCILYCRTVEKQRHRLPGSEEDTLVAGCAEDLGGKSVSETDGLKHEKW